MAEQVSDVEVTTQLKKVLGGAPERTKPHPEGAERVNAVIA